MTDELSPAARALLDRARDGMTPDAAAIARIRSNIDVAVASSAAGGAAAGSAIASKLAIVGVIAAIAIGAVVYRQSNRTIAEPAPAAAPSATPTTPPAPTAAITPTTPAPDPTSPPVVIAETPDAPIEMPPSIVSKRPSPPSSGSAVSSGSSAPPVAKPIDLAREVELVDRAMAALKSGDPTAALAAVRMHARETAGKGQLAEDAAAIEIEAMCKLGQPTAKRLAAFDARWPSSAQRSRLSTTLTTCE